MGKSDWLNTLKKIRIKGFFNCKDGYNLKGYIK